MNKIVIVGFGSAGFAALMSIRRKDPRAEVVIIDPKTLDLTHPCGIPYSLEGLVPRDNLRQDVALKSMGARRVKARAELIDRAKKTIIARGEEGEIAETYDTIIISTGFCPFIPSLKNARELLGKGLYTLASVEDLDALAESLKGASNALVIGGGAIGLEAAIALKHHVTETTLLEMRDQLLPGVLDADMSEHVVKLLEELNIRCRTGTAVEEILGTERLGGVRTGDGEMKADVCVLAAGFRASTELASASGLTLGNLGIAVDSQLRTSDPDIYAAGDCIEAVSVIDGKVTSAKLATGAYRQGTLAGANACGAALEYRGTAGTFVTKLAGLEVAGTGYNTETASRNGFTPVSGKIKSGTLPEYFPGGGEIAVKVITDKNTGRVLGAQAVGDGAAARINVVSAAVEFGMSLDDLSRIEMAYCPAVSEVYDPLMRAADFASRRVKRQP